MNNQLYQWNFVIKGLIPDPVKLKRKIWLKKGELLLEKKGNKLHAYLLGDDNNRFSMGEEIVPYLWFTSLISSNTPDVEGGSGVGISSKEELGKAEIFSVSISMKQDFSDEAVAEIEKHAHKFIYTIRSLHDNYIEIVNSNEFIKRAMNYFYEAEKKFVYSDEGFISATISMESLFNEGSSDIKYKISHRAAFLLGFCGIDPIEAFEKLKSLYVTRSKIVHGDDSTKYDNNRDQITRYTRLSVIIFLILLNNDKRKNIKKDKRKSELLKEIDNAMLNDEMRKTLKKEINNGLKKFKLNIPRTFEVGGKDGYRVTAW